MEKYNHQSFVTVYVMSSKGSLVTDPERKGCGPYAAFHKDSSQFNALKNKYFYRSAGEKKTYEDFSSFGDVKIFKYNGLKKVLIKDMKTNETYVLNWETDYDYTFDNNQARGKVELPFSKNYFGIKFVKEKNGKCFVGFSDLITGSDKHKIYIKDVESFVSANTTAAFGIAQNFEGNYRLYACFLEYYNVIPSFHCFVLESGQFYKEVKDGKVIGETMEDPDEFGRGFDNIRDDSLVRSKLPFDFESMKEILSKHSPIMSTGSNVFFKGKEDQWIVVDPRGNSEGYKDNEIPPNIIIGSFFGKSSKLNGIWIDYVGTSCKLEIKDGEVIGETMEEPDNFGRGFDNIRDDSLVRSKLPFDFESMKEILTKHSPIMSTGSNVFFKGKEDQWIVIDPRGNSEGYKGDYDSVIDDSFIKLP
uniref:WG repeat-containing protein n=1 Tax=Panagrolaimus sp. JU765 TaxID=591449 RepID=A0AC34RM99_9BILA